MNTLHGIGLAVVIAALMEKIAWLTHRFNMHGAGRRLYRSHHESERWILELNVVYAVVFAASALVLFAAGRAYGESLWWTALGMTIYGALYAPVHDGLVHGRFCSRWTPRRGFRRRLVHAHHRHHAVKKRDGTVSFGFLTSRSLRRLERDLRRAGAAENDGHPPKQTPGGSR